MKSKDLNLNQIPVLLGNFLAALKRYRVILFLVFFAAIYGFLVWQINSYNSVEPSDDQVAAKLQSSNPPHIDKNVVGKIEKLKDNSVNVQTLFDQARNNPFQE